MACRTCDMIRGILLSDSIGEVPQNVALSMASERLLDPVIESIEERAIAQVKKTKRSAIKYQRRYSKNFREMKRKYQTKTGRWVKNGFRLAVKAAHKKTKKEVKPIKKTKSTRRAN